MNACACVVGWHFNCNLIRALLNAPEIQLFIVSHKPPLAVPDWFAQEVPEGRVFYEANNGYDWGAYQQFIDKNIWRNYDIVFFLHDDLILTDPQVFRICCDLLDDLGMIGVIGNGRVSIKRDWPRTHIQSYAHSIWKPPSWEFAHDTVRGSFFAMPTKALEQIGDFEILWDRRKLFGIGAGNYSLRATCGKIQHILGKNAFHFLSESYRNSSYLIEMERGLEKKTDTQLPFRQRIIQFVLVRYAKTIMTWYMNSNATSQKYLAKHMQSFFSTV